MHALCLISLQKVLVLQHAGCAGQRHVVNLTGKAARMG